jgi:hypothetical protein
MHVAGDVQQWGSCLFIPHKALNNPSFTGNRFAIHFETNNVCAGGASGSSRSIFISD